MVENFGKWVHCTSYLKTVRDGRCLETVRGDGEIEEVRYVGIGDDIPDKCECEGSLEFLKTYYEKKQVEFDGVLVGTKKIVVDGYLYADTDYHPYVGEHIVVGKQANTTVLCGIVFFGNNQKRYVPMDDLEVIPDEMRGVIVPPCSVGETVYVIVSCGDIMMHHDNDYLTGTGAIECPFENDCDKDDCNDEYLRVVKTVCSGIYQDEASLSVYLKDISRTFYSFDFGNSVFVGENAEKLANKALRRMQENVDSKESCR